MIFVKAIVWHFQKNSYAIRKVPEEKISILKYPLERRIYGTHEMKLNIKIFEACRAYSSITNSTQKKNLYLKMM
jgi:hypothetical protein